MKSISRLFTLFAIISMLSFFTISETTAAEPEWIYTVRTGDTLIDLTNRYLEPSASWEKLQQLNKVPDPKHLQPNSKLRIPVAWLKRESAFAEVVRVQGEAQKLSDTGQGTARIEPGMQLRVGDTIMTNTGSTLTLRFVDGSRLLVAENSKVTLSTLLVYGKTGMADTKLKLHEGGVETQVSPQKGSAAKYEIKAPTLNLGVRGTDFRVRVDGSGATRSEVLEGRVAAAGERHQVLVNAGFGTLAKTGEAPRLPKPLLQAPDLGTMPLLLERVPLRFQWQAVPGAQNYRAQIFADRSFDRLLLDGIFPATTAKWVDLPDGKYVLRVRAIDSDGLEGINTDHDFRLKARPEPPFINEPVDGGKVYGDKAIFRWAKSSIEQAYRVQVSDAADFSRLLSDERNTGTNEYTLALLPGQYYWRIASLMPDGDQGPYSDAQAFTQRKIPASPALEPPKVDDKALSFRWKAGVNGEKYQFQFARDNEFKNPLLDTVTAESQISLPRPDAGNYFMRVKTIDADGFAGPFGQVQVVEIPASPWWLLIPAAILLSM